MTETPELLRRAQRELLMLGDYGSSAHELANEIAAALTRAPSTVEVEATVRTCATCHAILADGPQPAMTYESPAPARPDGEAVAWRWKYKGRWILTSEKPGEDDIIGGLEFQPLYASPPPASAGVRAALEAIIIRCEEGDKNFDWRSTIADIARRALAPSGEKK